MRLLTADCCLLIGLLICRLLSSSSALKINNQQSAISNLDVHCFPSSTTSASMTSPVFCAPAPPGAEPPGAPPPLAPPVAPPPPAPAACCRYNVSAALCCAAVNCSSAR